MTNGNLKKWSWYGFIKSLTAGELAKSSTFSTLVLCLTEIGVFQKQQIYVFMCTECVVVKVDHQMLMKKW